MNEPLAWDSWHLPSVGPLDPLGRGEMVVIDQNHVVRFYSRFIVGGSVVVAILSLNPRHGPLSSVYPVLSCHDPVVILSYLLPMLLVLSLRS
ncbi:hypothetical protein B0O80DRAFT_455579 [Mortierella sp. GBAus27b]|nr:hypothetical protein B0O80DRAFT_455579 [Mortierella sp. GBAus27b]